MSPATPATPDTPVTEIEMLYTIFEEDYDDDSIDAVYLMSQCDFNQAYDMLMLPFSHLSMRYCQCGELIPSADHSMCSTCYIYQKKRIHNIPSSIKQSTPSIERKQPTTSVSLMSFLVPERKNKNKNKNK